jgi:hypothetical protein
MSGDGTHGTLFKTGPFSDEEDMQLRAILRDELEVRYAGSVVQRERKKKTSDWNKLHRYSLKCDAPAETECGVERREFVACAQWQQVDQWPVG